MERQLHRVPHPSLSADARWSARGDGEAPAPQIEKRLRGFGVPESLKEKEA